MKKIAILRFWYEGNSFSPAPAMLADFQRREWLAGAEAATFYAGKGVETGAAVDFLQAHDDIEGHFLRCAAAYPAGEVEAEGVGVALPRILRRPDPAANGRARADDLAIAHLLTVLAHTHRDLAEVQLEEDD